MTHKNAPRNHHFDFDAPEDDGVRHEDLDRPEPAIVYEKGRWQKGWMLVGYEIGVDGEIVHCIVKDKETGLTNALEPERVMLVEPVAPQVRETRKETRDRIHTVFVHEPEVNVELVEAEEAGEESVETDEAEEQTPAIPEDPILKAEVDDLADAANNFEVFLEDGDMAEALLQRLYGLLEENPEDEDFVRQVHGLLPHIYAHGPRAQYPIEIRRALAPIINRATKLDRGHMNVYRKLMERIPLPRQS